MDSKSLIYAGGVYHVCWALFDSFWPIILDWNKRLSSLDDLHRALPYILSRLLVVLYLMLAYISFVHTADLIETPLGRTMLFFVSIYWSIRFVMQIQFMSFAKTRKFNIQVKDLRFPWPVSRLSNQAVTGLLFLIMATGVALYLIPALLTR